MTSLLARGKASVDYRFKKVLRGDALKALLRRRAQRRGWPADGSATIVIVTWNTLAPLAVALEAIRRHSAPTVEVIVIDNGSTDGTRAFLRRRTDVRHVVLPRNIGHGAAFDIGAHLVRTEFIVSLDVDAFPIAEGWVERLVAPLSAGANVAGVRVNRSYAHPCTLAIRTARFVEQRHTFTAKWASQGLGVDHWDAGELVSMREQPSVHLFEDHTSYGPGWLGTTWPGLTFHLFYAAWRPVDDTTKVLEPEFGITRQHVLASWDRACTELLGLDAQARRELIDGAQPASR